VFGRNGPFYWMNTDKLIIPINIGTLDITNMTDNFATSGMGNKRPVMIRVCRVHEHPIQYLKPFRWIGIKAIDELNVVPCG
jgi:hypothetical protein